MPTSTVCYHDNTMISGDFHSSSLAKEKHTTYILIMRTDKIMKCAICAEDIDLPIIHITGLSGKRLGSLPYVVVTVIEF